MAHLLVLSVTPADAALSVGALLANMPNRRAIVAHANGGAELCRETYTALGVSVQTSRNSDQSLEAWLLQLLAEDGEVDAVLMPLGLHHEAEAAAVKSACLQVSDSVPLVRWLQYYEQPAIGASRGKYPELAFARRVRGLAEVDEDASMFNWKPLGAPADNDPLSRKLEACLRLPPELLHQLLFDPQGFAYPESEEEVRTYLARVLGQREWLTLLEQERD